MATARQIYRMEMRKMGLKGKGQRREKMPSNFEHSWKFGGKQKFGEKSQEIFFFVFAAWKWLCTKKYVEYLIACITWMEYRAEWSRSYLVRNNWMHPLYHKMNKQANLTLHLQPEFNYWISISVFCYPSAIWKKEIFLHQNCFSLVFVRMQFMNTTNAIDNKGKSAQEKRKIITRCTWSFKMLIVMHTKW